MAQNAKPWTKAIEDFLADGEWHSTEEVLAVGSQLVPEERALHEMGSKQLAQSQDRRIAIGRRNVASQAITGMTRFGKAEYGDGRKQVRWISGKSRSLGDLAAQVEDLQRKLTEVVDRLEAAETQLEFYERKFTGESDDAGEKLLAAAGLQASS